MSEPPVPANRFERRRRRNREALLEAAIELFQARGVRGTKLEDICERADVSPRTFFNHFETREHLYAAIARQRTRQAAALFDAPGEPGSLRESLPRLFGRIASYLDARPAYRELVGEMLHVRTDGRSELARSSPLGRAALRFVERGIAADGARSTLAPETLADILLGTLTLAISNWSASESYDLPRELERSAAALLLLFTAAEAIDATRGPLAR